MTNIDLATWEHSCGPVPDYESPLGPVFDSGVTYTLGLLADALGSGGYSLDGATETHDGDVLAAIGSILRHASPEAWSRFAEDNDRLAARSMPGPGTQQETSDHD